MRKSGREYRVYNVEEADYAGFTLTDGDEITVDSVINRFENRVEIKGAVFREGRYALKDNVSTVKQLIEKSEGVRGDAFLARAVLYREKPDFTLEVVSVNVKGLLNGTAEDVELRNNDLLYIPSIFDLQEEQTISISGAVGYPGTYKFAEEIGRGGCDCPGGRLERVRFGGQGGRGTPHQRPEKYDGVVHVGGNFYADVEGRFVGGGRQGFRLDAFR